MLASIPGFVPRVAFGVGMVSEHMTEFPYVNSERLHLLPAVVRGFVLGYRSGTCTLHVSTVQLDRLIEVLKPAEACAEYDHPNLWSWEKLRARTTSESSNDYFVAVFIGDRADRTADDHQAMFRRQARW